MELRIVIIIADLQIKDQLGNKWGSLLTTVNEGYLITVWEKHTKGLFDGKMFELTATPYHLLWMLHFRI